MFSYKPSGSFLLIGQIGGKKLTSTELERAFVRFGLESGLDVSGCKDECDVLLALKKLVNHAG